MPLPRQQIAFTRDDQEIASYFYGPEFNRPFVFPLIGPAGRSVTRFGHPTDPQGHRHHYSVWVAHKDVNGVSFWEDEGPRVGRIVHRSLAKIEEGASFASIRSVNAWIDAVGQTLLDEERRTSVKLLGEGEWLLLIEVRLSAAGEAVTLGRTPYGLLGVRVANPVSVRHGGGQIRNSLGGTNESQVLGQRARWVDYSGRIAGTIENGATLFDAPTNPGFPNFFHVRDDGWMCLCPTYEKSRIISAGGQIVFRFGVYVHGDTIADGKIEKVWRSFAENPPSSRFPEAAAK